MLASSSLARPRYAYPRSSFPSFSVSHSAVIRSVTPSLPSSPLRVPSPVNPSLDSEELIPTWIESSHRSDNIVRRKPASPSSSSPPALSSPPASSASTVSQESLNESYSLKRPSSASTAIPTEPLPEAEVRVRFLQWLNAGRLTPLDLHCSREVYISTARLLEMECLLPRMARDFDPTTSTWHLRSRPHILHEIGHPVTGEIRRLLEPQLARSALAGLSKKIVWHRGSDTTPLPGGGVKEPDAGIGLSKRALPTIVIEVGYSESRAKLRLDAHRWLQTGLPDRRVKRKRGEPDEGTSNINPRPVMLVLLISFEGKRPSILDSSFEYSESDFGDVGIDGTKVPKPLTVWVELWRLAPVGANRPSTRSNTGRTPAMADRKRFWPSLEPNESDSVELFATDIFGSDKVRDPGNTTRFKIPLSLFQKVLGVHISIMKAQEEAGGEYVSDSDDDMVVLGEEAAIEDAEDIVGHGADDQVDKGMDTEARNEGGDAVLQLRDIADVVITVTPGEKRQKP